MKTGVPPGWTGSLVRDHETITTLSSWFPSVIRFHGLVQLIGLRPRTVEAYVCIAGILWPRGPGGLQAALPPWQHAFAGAHLRVGRRQNPHHPGTNAFRSARAATERPFGRTFRPESRAAQPSPPAPTVAQSSPASAANRSTRVGFGVQPKANLSCWTAWSVVNPTESTPGVNQSVVHEDVAANSKPTANRNPDMLTRSVSGANPA